MKLISFLFIFILLSLPSYPQELDITPYLKKIEAGEKDEVAANLSELKRANPNSSSLLYLEGLLTEDGEESYQIYKLLIDKFPKSKYEDAVLYRIYCYFTAVDKVEMAENYLNRLKKDFPDSPYLKLTEKTTFTLKSEELKKEDTKQIQTSKLKDKKFTIQAGAFTSKENALKLKADFEKAGYTSHISQKTVGGTLFYIVYVGRFSNENEAKSSLRVINSKFKLQGWIVKLE